MLNNNFHALILTFAIAIIWLRLVDFTAHRGWLESKLSRKIIHIGTGPIFVLCWQFFTDLPSARFLAALVPLLITFQFLLIGLGIIKDEPAVQAMSRTGNPKEILFGPLFYGIIFVVLTIIYWFDSPIGMVALMTLCGGDGFADIIGRRFGKTKLPWSNNKSWAGSLGMFFGGWTLSMLVVFLYIAAGYFPGTMISYFWSITIINIAATIVESMPVKDFDNLSISVVSVLIGHLFF